MNVTFWPSVALKWLFLQLACTFQETCESIWPPNASLYAASTCGCKRRGCYTCAREATHFVFTSADAFSFYFRRRLEYTREQLLEFKKQVDDKVGQGQGEEQGGGFGGFGGFGGGSSEVSFALSLTPLTFQCFGGPFCTTLEEFENAALFLRLGQLSTLIRR